MATIMTAIISSSITQLIPVSSPENGSEELENSEVKWGFTVHFDKLLHSDSD
jgi:hypothetical protein